MNRKIMTRLIKRLSHSKKLAWCKSNIILKNDFSFDMNISELGEFGLIDRISSNIKTMNPSTKTGIGDDAAIIFANGDEVTLVSTDMFMEGIHFNLVYVDMMHLGYKTAMAAMSDIFAMNAMPSQMLVSIALSHRFAVEDVDAFYDGVKRACGKWNVDVVGGDTTSSLTGLAVTMTCIGHAKEAEIVKRSGAKDTDLICVSGDLGAAYMGVQILEREKSVYYQQIRDIQQKYSDKEIQKKHIDALLFNPEFSGKEYLIERQLQPEARGDVINTLREIGVRPTSMIDISDGLASELMHICKASGCGCRIFEKSIPIDYQTAVAAEEFNMNLTTCALNGGDDYELLFTVPIGDLSKVENREGIKLIGHITKPQYGAVLVTRDDNEFQLKAQGWHEKK